MSLSPLPDCLWPLPHHVEEVDTNSFSSESGCELLSEALGKSFTALGLGVSIYKMGVDESLASSPSSNFLGTCETPYSLLVQDQVGLLGCPWTLSLGRQRPGAGWSPTQAAIAAPRSSQPGRGERLPREGSLELGFEG